MRPFIVTVISKFYLPATSFFYLLILTLIRNNNKYRYLEYNSFL
jgi:hypothetical protein